MRSAHTSVLVLRGEAPQKATFTMKAIPISHPDAHPVHIAIVENNVMRRWDVQLDWGNWVSREEATQAGLRLKDVLEKHMGVTGSLVQ